MIDYAKLAAEIAADPLQHGYQAHVTGGNDIEIAKLLNVQRPAIQLRRGDITPADILDVIDVRDFVATPGEPLLSWFRSLMTRDAIRFEFEDGTPTRTLTNLLQLLNAADTNGSRARLVALAKRTGSRAEQLFGVGTVITASDVAASLRGMNAV